MVCLDDARQLQAPTRLSSPLTLVDNPVATARSSFLRGQGRYTGPDPSRELPLDGGVSRVPAGGASEVSLILKQMILWGVEAVCLMESGGRGI